MDRIKNRPWSEWGRYWWVTILIVLVAVAAQSQSGVLFVDGNNVGIGIDTPARKLDVRSNGDARVDVTDTSSTTAARTLFSLSNKGFPRFVLTDSNTADQWLMAVAGGGTFVFSKVGSGVNEFVVRSGGDLIIGGTLTEGSSRDIKRNFEMVDGREVLSRVVNLPISEWSYKAGNTADRHIGPMAEDFYQSFAYGSDDRHVAPRDMSGVALAAIQGLNAKMEELSEQVRRLEAENRALKEKLPAAY